MTRRERFRAWRRTRPFTAGIVLGIVSFPTSNLGGFFIGMLLAMVGGAMAFAWEPGEPEEAVMQDAEEPAAMQ